MRDTPILAIGAAKRRGEEIGLRGVDVSLTHSHELAIAAVVGAADDAPIDRLEHRERLVSWLKEQGRL